MEKFNKVWVYTTTGLAVGAATLGVAYLAIDIGPDIAAGLLAIPKQDVINLACIAAFGAVTLAFTKYAGKPFDLLMDRMYPDDIPPKKVA